MKRVIEILLMAVVGLTIIWFGGSYVLGGGICQGPVLTSITTADASVTASIYETDCGAMTARRTNVALSDSHFNGRREGNTVVTFLNVPDSGVHLTWRTNRDLIVDYTFNADVEWAVSKTRGVKIYSQPGPL